MSEKMRDEFAEWWNDNCADQPIFDYGFETIGQDISYHAWQAALQSQAPEGWKLVPVEPTQSMLTSALFATPSVTGEHYKLLRDAYAAMLAAAPTQPQQQEQKHGSAGSSPLDSSGEAWHVEYQNETGPDDEGFWEWWEVTDGQRVYRAGEENDATILCDLLNQRWPRWTKEQIDAVHAEAKELSGVIAPSTPTPSESQAANTQEKGMEAVEGMHPVSPDYYQNPTTEEWWEHPADESLLDEMIQISGPLKVGDEYELDVSWSGKQKFRVTSVEGDDVEVEHIGGDQLYLAPPSIKAAEQAAVVAFRASVANAVNEQYYSQQSDGETSAARRAYLSAIQDSRAAIFALPIDTSALEEFGMRVAVAVRAEVLQKMVHCHNTTEDDLRAIVSQTIDKINAAGMKEGE